MLDTYNTTADPEHSRNYSPLLCVIPQSIQVGSVEYAADKFMYNYHIKLFLDENTFQITIAESNSLELTHGTAKL